MRTWYVTCIQEINQPAVKYIKLPGANFADELPLNPPSAKRMELFTTANAFLAGYDRMNHPIKGDGTASFEPFHT